MNFDYKVEQIQDVQFKPTDLQITVGEGLAGRVTTEEGEFVRVHSTLTQTTPVSIIVENREILMPVSVLGAINGFDPATGRNTIDPAMLAQILAGFNLKLAPTTAPVSEAEA